MKKQIKRLLALGLAAGLLTACGNTPVVQYDGSVNDTQQQVEAEKEAENKTETAQVVDGDAVKTGVSIQTTLEGENAGAQGDGYAKSNISIVAVTVGEDGIIDDCTIDGIQTTVNFNTEGKLGEVAKEYPSKNELGEDYGMKGASPIGKEWNEQAEAVAQYAIGKTVDELKNGAVDEAGKAKDADLAASATIYIGGFVSQIEEAVNNATYLGASKGDSLVITQTTHGNNSKDAGAEGDGLVQAYATIGILTLKDKTISSMIIDGVQANINFDTTGTVTSDLTAKVQTKNELGEAYGMKAASGIGKEWNEQAAAFASYVTGKTLDEAMGIAVTEEGKAADADLAASVTVSLGGFNTLIEKAADLN